MIYLPFIHTILLYGIACGDKYSNTIFVFLLHGGERGAEENILN
jgi:hypothetical protein